MVWASGKKLTDMMETVEQSLTTNDILLRVNRDNHLADIPDFLISQSYLDDAITRGVANEIGE